MFFQLTNPKKDWKNIWMKKQKKIYSARHFIVNEILPFIFKLFVGVNDENSDERSA